jgi:hypothetical protein
MAGRGTRGSSRRPPSPGWDSGQPELGSPGLRWVMETLSMLPDAPVEVRAAVRAAVKRAVRGLPWVPGFVARDVGVKRRKPIGRPRGRHSLDADQAVAIAAAIDVHGLSQVDVLRHLD